MEPFDGVAERRQPIAAAIRDLRRVKDSLGLVSAQGDRVGGVLDQPELDRVGDGPSSSGPFGARFVRCLHPQVLRHERRRSLVERVPLAGDFEDDVHPAEPSSAIVGARSTFGVHKLDRPEYPSWQEGDNAESEAVDSLRDVRTPIRLEPQSSARLLLRRDRYRNIRPLDTPPP